ncbi:MAG: MerR family transcriptional regulator [Pedosphaera sp.]|nr:MerR family transcriptional regulator [Pedosphaera sp.]
MIPASRPDDTSPPVIESMADVTFTLEILTELSGISSQTILFYREHGLIATVPEGDSSAPKFNEESLRALRRIEHLRDTFEMNIAGLKRLTSLMEEVESLRAELRARR